MRAYKEASDEELFKIEFVQVDFKETDAPGSPRSRVTCEKCREGVNDSREIIGGEGQVLCRPCGDGAYYRVIVTQ